MAHFGPPGTSQKGNFQSNLITLVQGSITHVPCDVSVFSSSMKTQYNYDYMRWTSVTNPCDVGVSVARQPDTRQPPGLADIILTCTVMSKQNMNLKKE